MESGELYPLQTLPQHQISRGSRCVNKNRASSQTLHLRAPGLSSGSIVQEVLSILSDLMVEVILVVRVGALKVDEQFVLVAKEAIREQLVKQHAPLVGRSMAVNEEELVPEHPTLALPHLRLLGTLQKLDSTEWHLKPQLFGILWRCTGCLWLDWQ